MGTVIFGPRIGLWSAEIHGYWQQIFLTFCNLISIDWISSVWNTDRCILVWVSFWVRFPLTIKSYDIFYLTCRANLFLPTWIPSLIPGSWHSRQHFKDFGTGGANSQAWILTIWSPATDAPSKQHSTPPLQIQISLIVGKGKKKKNPSVKSLDVKATGETDLGTARHQIFPHHGLFIFKHIPSLLFPCLCEYVLI